MMMIIKKWCKYMGRGGGYHIKGDYNSSEVVSFKKVKHECVD